MQLRNEVVKYSGTSKKKETLKKIEASHIKVNMKQSDTEITEIEPKDISTIAVSSSNSQAFTELPATEKSAYIEILCNLNKNGKLFKEVQDGSLTRIGPAEAKHLLEFGEEVKIVTVHSMIESKERAHYYSNSENKGTTCLSQYSSSDSFADDRTEKSIKLEYYVDTVFRWDDLYCVDKEGKGIVGASRLPADGTGTVTINYEWERTWMKTSMSSLDGSFDGHVHDRSLSSDSGKKREKKTNF